MIRIIPLSGRSHRQPVQEPESIKSTVSNRSLVCVKERQEVVYVDKSEDDDEVKVIEAKKVEEGAGDGAKADEEDAETYKVEAKEETEAGPPAPNIKKPGLSMAGLMITVLGAIGIVGAYLLDPILNMTDSSHPAGISIGNTQMMGIGVAAVVLVVGILTVIKPHKKPSSG
jgi:hypothetical protein